MEAVLIITPRSPFSSGSLRAIFSEHWVSTLKVPIRLMSITFLNSSIGKRPARPNVLVAPPPRPAQFTQICIAPNAAITSSMAAVIDCSSVTLTEQKMALPPSCLATALPSASSISNIATFAPPAIKLSTVAFPKPEAPPVTTATLFCKSICFSA